jgi:hypothetical protein
VAAGPVAGPIAIFFEKEPAACRLFAEASSEFPSEILLD